MMMVMIPDDDCAAAAADDDDADDDDDAAVWCTFAPREICSRAGTWVTTRKIMPARDPKQCGG